MTRDELLATLRDLVEPSLRLGGAEEPHIEADDALLEYINDDEITTAYTLIRRWHS